MTQETGNEIAIIGMAGRFPGAANIAAFWRNLREGVESVTVLTDRELLEAGVRPELLRQPNYVKSAILLEGIELFDASFFGLSPSEATILDPQIRFFLECGWEALEDAGYVPESFEGPIGVFAGAKLSQYLSLLESNYESMTSHFVNILGNDKDYLSTFLSYKLNLTGPSLTLQTACSTSLTSVHVACQSLLNGECDMALAGGSSISIFQGQGYLREEGSILSSDGHCRAFDKRADGTLFGDGTGVVVLKRLQDAVAARDHIYAVIKGSAMNNDGARKVGFTAPSVQGQMRVIREALTMAACAPSSIGYVETHGTGTSLGDPIELSALMQAFGEDSGPAGTCAIGSAKTNIGHLDVASGVAGLIKATLAVQHGQVPPSLNFTEPNPEIPFGEGPFYVNARLSDWPRAEGPRRAGVSSFGIGGTNVHAILEEAPAQESAPAVRPSSLLVLSARTEAALEAATSNLATYLEEHPEASLEDVSSTLQVGRRHFSHRRVLVCRDVKDAAAALRESDSGRLLTASAAPGKRPPVFLFPGHGGEYLGMGEALYRSEPVFREAVDRCSRFLQPLLGVDLRRLLYSPADPDSAERQLQRMALDLPALFMTEYAMARQWMAWGVQPESMIGHSLGEYAAACVSGVLSVEDALTLVALRGRLFEELPLGEGGMLAVALPKGELQPLLGPSLEIAIINGPANCVVAGPTADVERLEKTLEARGVSCRRLRLAYAAHSRMLEPLLERFLAGVRGVKLGPPRIPFISNVTGTWITPAEATDPGYWVRHLRQTVLFSDGIAELRQQTDRVFLEVGPGRVLTSFCLEQPGARPGLSHLSSLPARQDPEREAAGDFVLQSLGRLYLAGVSIDWTAVHSGAPRNRVSLPTYPFERKRYWAEPSKTGRARSAEGQKQGDALELERWLSIPSWLREPLAPPPSPGVASPRNWLLFMDAEGVGEALVRHLEGKGETIVQVQGGSAFARLGERRYSLAPGVPGGYEELLRELRGRGQFPHHVLHLWSLPGRHEEPLGEASHERAMDLMFFSLLHLGQALGGVDVGEPLRLGVITDQLHPVTGHEALGPLQAVTLGPCRVLPQELPFVRGLHLDVALSGPDALPLEALAARLTAELLAEHPESMIALRGPHRWLPHYQPAPVRKQRGPPARLRERGVYLITGGLGEIGLTLAGYLAETVKARLVLTCRSEFPPREEWETWLARNPRSDELRRKITRLLALEALGAEVRVYPVDVADAPGMRRMLTQVREHFGPIQGVIHCAGVPTGGSLLLKTREAVRAVLAPKTRGTLLLRSLVGEELDFFVVNSSLVATLGGVGQIDHAAASAFLDHFAHAEAQRGRFTFSIGWDAWSNIERLAATASRAPGTAQVPAAQVQRLEHPLFESRQERPEGGWILSSRFGPGEDWFLGEHRLQGTALLPGTMYLELARAAFELVRGGPAVRLRDLVFLKPLLVEEGTSREIQTVLTPEETGFRFTIRGRASGLEPWQEHATGRLAELIDPAPERWELAALERRCERSLGKPAALQDRSALPVTLGPHWDCLESVRVGKDEALAVLALPEPFAAEVGTYGLHPSLLDMATAIAALFLRASSDELFLPFGYQEVSIRGPLPRRIISQVWRKGGGGSERTMTFGGRILDEQGQEWLSFDDYTMARAGSMLGASEERGALLIQPWQGARIFERVLSQFQPQVLVCPREFEVRVAQHEASIRLLMGAMEGRSGSAPVIHERPALTSKYAAPINDVQRRIAQQWQEFLGLDRVGVHDSFFELGGSSLRMVEMRRRLERTFQVEIPLQTVMEHPTIARLALVITQLTLGDDEASIVAQLEQLSDEDAEALLRFSRGAI